MQPVSSTHPFSQTVSVSPTPADAASSVPAGWSPAELKPFAERCREDVVDADGQLVTDVGAIAAEFGFPRISAGRRQVIASALGEVGVTCAPPLSGVNEGAPIKLTLAGAGATPSVAATPSAESVQHPLAHASAVELPGSGG